MNKLITTNNGGYPFVLDDLRFVDESVREGFKNTFSMLGGATYNDGFFLTMDDRIPTANDYSFAPGSQFPEIGVFMNNEIWILPASTLPTSLSAGIFLWVVPDIAFTNSAPGQKVLQNGTTVQSYEVRRAKLIQSNTPQTPPAGYPGGFLGLSFNVTWDVNLFNTYLSRFLNNSGLTQLRNDYYTFYNVEKQQIDTDLFSHLQRLDAIDAPWTKISGNALKPMLNWLYQNGSINSPSVFNAPVGTLDATSFIKIKQIGKTLFLNINIENFVFPKPDASGTPSTVVAGLMIDLFNFGITTINPSISGTLNASERNFPSPISNVAYITRFNSQMIRLVLNNFSSESSGAWNYNYHLTQTTYGGATVTNRQGNGYPYLTDYPKWSLRGSFQIELD